MNDSIDMRMRATESISPWNVIGNVLATGTVPVCILAAVAGPTLIMGHDSRTM
jgi:hypothetical protein